MRYIYIIVFVCLTINYLGAQPNENSSVFEKKHIEAYRINTPPTIDGKLDEPFWLTLPVARDFVIYSPGNGQKPSQATQIMFAFDDEALFIGAILYDTHIDSLCNELGRRDQIELLNTDYISFDILPYNDGLNMYEFKLSPANLQNDCKYSALGQDFNWDAVWESATRINADSWMAEVRIPYSALRFPKVPVQEWGINMWRNLHRNREYSTWTYVDNKDQDIFKYYGTLRGIRDINPPIRLSVTPYLAGYLEKTPGSNGWEYSLRGGLDLRYGINESYTLDMMLIPDFGQVQSDDIVLNLTPFEIRYDEKRQFFSEATELFNKCGIFYSRRVGSTPRDYFKPYQLLGENEIIKENPDETRIINATKISGRNSKGLGVGFFNAMTLASEAIIADTITGTERSVKTQAFTNYNVLVLDQNLKNNSYATFINTHYWIPKSGYTANVSGVETRLNTKSRSLAFIGRFNMSQIYQPSVSPQLGVNYLVSLSRPKGKYQYEISREALDSKYSHNDMGYLANNNEAQNSARFSYIIFDPVWKIQSSHSELSFTHRSLNADNEFISIRLQTFNMTTFKSFWTNYIQVGGNPNGYVDFYESRTWGWKYVKPASVDANWKIASDNRKAFRIHNSIGVSNAWENNNHSWFIESIGRMRFSDKFTVTVSLGYDKNFNDYGWVNTSYDSLWNATINFGRRDVTSVSNILNLKYIFNTKMSLNLRGRHYWSRAEYFDYYTLQQDGKLAESDYEASHSLSFNVFTADLQYIWYFAPGSEISLVWKNYINMYDDKIHINYRDDFQNTITAPQSNSFSVRVLYYIDYARLKSRLVKS